VLGLVLQLGGRVEYQGFVAVRGSRWLVDEVARRQAYGNYGSLDEVIKDRL